MIIFLNVFSKNSYNNQKQKQTKRRTPLKKNKQYTTINIIPYPLITLSYKSIILINKYY